MSYSFIQEKVISAHHCHCKDCQRATGSGKATILFLAKKNLTIEGELKYFESKGSSGSHIKRGFC
ncbi:MAG TPA: GFA family protein, partial [Gammaproteobacteria bacterium]|nr:GFA family protein [Gammaproteobacteria bacterium]